MEVPAQNLTSSICPTPEIAAYIDGELEPRAEHDLEQHLKVCRECLIELNFQKQFLNGLDQTLKQQDTFELPADFATTVAVKAESTVSGLRRPRERFLTVLICTVFALFILLFLTQDSGRVLLWISGVVESAVAVASFFFRLVYSLFYGVGVIVRSLGGRYLLPGTVAVLFLTACALILLPITRTYFRAPRT